LSEAVEIDLQRSATGGNRKKEVRVDAVGVRQEMPHQNPVGGAGCREFELRQVGDHAFVEVDGAVLDLLEHERGGQEFGHRSEQEASVVAHGRVGYDVCHTVRGDAPMAIVVDPGNVAGHLARLAGGGDVFVQIGRVHAGDARTLTQGQGQAL
jgi:hypothetical protein